MAFSLPFLLRGVLFLFAPGWPAALVQVKQNPPEFFA
jgi:hypothetical protein